MKNYKKPTKREEEFWERYNRLVDDIVAKSKSDQPEVEAFEPENT